MKSLKSKLIEKWRGDIEREECEIATCHYIENRDCNICPLFFHSNNHLSAFCIFHKFLKLTKFQWSTIFAMLENIDAKYWTASKFKRSKFKEVFDKIMEYENV